MAARGNKKNVLSLSACLCYVWLMVISYCQSHFLQDERTNGGVETLVGLQDKLSHTHLRCQMSYCGDYTAYKYMHLPNGCQKWLQYGIYSHCFLPVQSVLEFTDQFVTDLNVSH